MVVSVTVENAVDTGVCTHVDILSLGHLLQTINNRGERQPEEPKQDYYFLGGYSSLGGYRVRRERPVDSGREERGRGVLLVGFPTQEHRIWRQFELQQCRGRAVKSTLALHQPMEPGREAEVVVVRDQAPAETERSKFSRG